MKKIVYLAVCIPFLFTACLKAVDVSAAEPDEHIGVVYSWASEQDTFVFSPDGTKIAVLKYSAPIILIGNTNTGEILRTFRGPTIGGGRYGCENMYIFETVVFSPDSTKIIVLPSVNPCGWVISPEDLRTMEVRERMAYNRMSRELLRKERLAETEAAHARILDINTGRVLVLRGHGRYSESVFSPDGKKIVSTNDDIVRTWDANTGRLLRTSRKTHADVLSQDGKE